MSYYGILLINQTKLPYKGKKLEQSPISNSKANTQMKFIAYLVIEYPFS